MSKKSPSDLISVIIPVYNIADFLPDCIESVLSQTYQDFEVILVDDASTDASATICDDIVSKDKRFQVIHKRRNTGLARARNSGLKKAKGTYTVYIDGDDSVITTYLEQLHKAITDTSADIAVCGYTDGGNCYPPAVPGKGITSGRTAAFRLLTRQENPDVIVWNKMYRTRLLKKHPFPDVRAHEDNFTTYRLYATAKKVVYIPDILYLYRTRTGSIMDQSHAKAHLTAKLKAARSAVNYFQSGQDDKLLQAAYFSELLAEFAFLDNSIKGDLPKSTFRTHRKKILKNKKLLKTPYRTSRTRVYIMLLRPLGGAPYKLFRRLTLK